MLLSLLIWLRLFDTFSNSIIEESQKLAVAWQVRKGGKRVIIKDRALVIEEVQKEFGSSWVFLLFVFVF